MNGTNLCVYTLKKRYLRPFLEKSISKLNQLSSASKDAKSMHTEKMQFLIIRISYIKFCVIPFYRSRGMTIRKIVVKQRALLD